MARVQLKLGDTFNGPMPEAGSFSLS